ncbi:MAG TPA: amidase [Actinomycetota bacterium]|nr:amidase [Actinomycetota bacterium]
MAVPSRPSRPPSLGGTRAALALGELSPEALLDQCLARLDASESTVKAWRALDPQGARAQAKRLDPAARAELPLWGIPVGVKDVIDAAGMATTAASAVLAGARPAAADAPAVARLREAGAVILGKTNTQEFAYGAVTAPTTNPRDEHRIPGGSSGGSAAALAAGHCLAALGTDTAGSIRVPAALCGVVGLKPRPGIVSLDGVIPLAPSLDTVGPMASDVAGVTLLWAALTGRSAPPSIAHGRAPEVRDLRVTAAAFSSLPEMEADVEAAYLDAIAVCGRLTNAPPRASVPAFADFDDPRRAVLMWEALRVHRARGWWPDRAGAYTEETRSYLQYAEDNLTGETVEAARRQCAKLAAGLKSATERAVLLAPTVPCQAPTIAEASARDPSQPRRPIVARLTRIPGPVNVAGLAALSVPCGNTTDGLPVGLMMIGQDEATLLRLGAAFEQAIGWEPATSAGLERSPD